MNLNKLIAPENIALIGASSNPGKIGYQILSNLIEGGFKSGIFPINLKEETVLNLKSEKSILDVKEQIDLAVIAIPSSFVKNAVLECVKAKVSSIIVISAGFAEVGDQGRMVQEEIAAICSQNDIALLGPNCLGLINTDINLNATFAKNMPQPGSISLVSQSGAIISSIIDWSNSSPIGFSKIFSIGNKAQLRESDLFEYLYNDENTKVIASYIENLEIDSKLTDVFLKNAKKKPTIVLFGGKSSFGARAALSHTGSIVNSYTSIKAYLEQAGIIIAETLEDLLLYSRVFSSYHQISGRNITIVTNAGGPGIAAADYISTMGLNLKPLNSKIQDQLKEVLRPEANITNPVDILGDASELEYQKAIEVILEDDQTDGVLIILTPQSATRIDETAEIIAKIKSDKPIIPSFVGGEILTKAKEIIESSKKPCFSFPEEAALAFRVLADFSLTKQTLLPVEINGREQFDLTKKYEILSDFKLPIVRYEESDSFEKIKDAAQNIGYPVVLKTADPLGHKSDAGKVILGIKNDSELHEAFNKVGSPAIVGPMINTKFEILLGIKKEKNLGVTVLFGTGGIFSEIIHDFSYRIAPINTEMALAMIGETKIGKILNGARNQKKYDLGRLAEIIVHAADFAMKFENIEELDFNPIIADKENFHMVDVRIVLGQETNEGKDEK